MTIIPEDFFEELYSKSLLKYITIGIYFIGIIVGLTSEVGIIWYEKHGNQSYYKQRGDLRFEVKLRKNLGIKTDLV